MNAKHTTQRARLLALLRSRGEEWIPLPEILALGFAQFGARLLEIRRDGHSILNKIEHKDGKVLSWYKLIACADRRAGSRGSLPPIGGSEPTPLDSAVTLFGNLSPDRSYRE